MSQKMPATSAALYAQAANAMSDLPTSDMRQILSEIRARDGEQGIAHFALGATAGEAERAKPVDLYDREHIEYRCDGLSRIMTATSDPQIAAQLFTGTTAFLTAARGSDLDHNLGSNDARTGLRDALNTTLGRDFSSIYRQNAVADGESLVKTNGGFDTFSSYARFEFGALDDAHGRETAKHAQEVLGNTLGTLEGDLLKAQRDNGAGLRHDFGSATFGSRANEQQNAAVTLGQLFGAVRNGLNQDFDVRYDRTVSDQKELQSIFQTSATIAKVAGFAAKASGTEELVGPLAAIEKGLDAAKDATPRQITVESDRTAVYDQVAQRFEDQLAITRHDDRLVRSFNDGSNDAVGQWTRYESDRDHVLKNREAQGMLNKPLGKLLGETVVPAPEKPAPLANERLTIDEARGVLPKGSDVKEWDGKFKHGRVLDLGNDTFAISTRAGRYEVFDVDRVNGVRPTPGAMYDLNPNGTLTQDVPSRDHHQR
ncbi:MAG: hypothetical protein JOZ86_01005 [Candidatus Eremiobacteraeota bacterium]|nr:hypothetical protein [Candidatus Eremiobacteraeota bacterium]